MSIVILVTDSTGFSTFLFAGALPRGSKIKTTSAAQLKGWIARAEVHRVLLQLNRDPDEPDVWISPKSVRMVQPFAVDKGDCLFDKSGKLTFFSGPRDKKSSNVLLVLAKFPSSLSRHKYGTGTLKAGGTGGLSSGDVDWEIVAVDEPMGDRVGDLDKIYRAISATKGVF